MGKTQDTAERSLHIDLDAQALEGLAFVLAEAIVNASELHSRLRCQAAHQVRSLGKTPPPRGHVLAQEVVQLRVGTRDLYLFQPRHAPLSGQLLLSSAVVSLLLRHQLVFPGSDHAQPETQDDQDRGHGHSLQHACYESVSAPTHHSARTNAQYPLPPHWLLPLGDWLLRLLSSRFRLLITDS